MQHDAGSLSRLLAGHIHALVRELLPSGRREGAEWRCGSLAGERGQSLGIHLTGSRAGVWADFSSGERGDALDLVAQALYRGDRKQAMDWARSWLGLDDRTAAPAPSHRPAPPPKDDAEQLREVAKRREAAWRIWSACPSSMKGTPVEHYLEGRGIRFSALGRVPGALRFDPGLWNRETQRKWPAMVAYIRGPDGQMAAIHRTWLARDDASGKWGKAPLQNAKMTLGTYVGGCIPLWRGASRKTLSDAPKGDTVALAEGIETALSVAMCCPDMRVLCAVSLANMGRMRLPPAIQTVVIAADNDTGNAPARKALDAACQWFAAEGRTVRVAMPEIKGQDWNDVLQGTTS
jgi:hypothetical protein